MELEIKKERLHVIIYQLLDKDYSEKLFEIIDSDVKWSDGTRRQTQVYGDIGTGYSITVRNKEINRKSLPWSEIPILETLRDLVSSTTGDLYNFCAIQKYPNGKIGIAPHKDKEIKTEIAGLSLGATRKLVLIPPRYNTIDKESIEISLPPGSLYVLKNPTNDHWAHSIKVESKIKDPRISLTFRYI